MNDPFDIKALRIDPATFAAPRVPAKIRKRREQFVMVPMLWVERLGRCRIGNANCVTPRATVTTYQVALHLLHLHWKNSGKPFKLPNGMLGYDGISSASKWRALVDLERRGLITVERRPKKSPIIHFLLRQL
jgi:hypothetical protein